jgi:hypothetical protein
MIDDRTVYRLLVHIAGQVIDEMRNGKTLEWIDDYVLETLRKKDRILVYDCMVGLPFGGEEGDAIAAHLRTLKRRKRSPQPTHAPATILPFRPEDQPT